MPFFFLLIQAPPGYGFCRRSLACSAVCSCPHLLVGPGRTRPSGCTANILAADGRRALVFFGFYLLLGAGTLRRRWLGSCICARADEHDQAGENIRPQPTGPFSSVAFLHGVQQPTTTRMTCGLHSTQRRFTCGAGRTSPGGK